MNKNKFVNPVVSSSKPQQYFQPTLHQPQTLEPELQKRGLNIKLGALLKGGFISQVYEATLDNHSVIVKHTEDLIPFDPTELFIGTDGHNVDTHVLNLLKNSSEVRVPRVLHHLPEITTTIMEDLRMTGFEIMIDQILDRKFPQNSAEALGKAMAHLAREARTWKKFETNLSAQQNAYERGLELRLAYPNSQTQYLALEKEFTGNNAYWAWLDGHPKNIFTNKNGSVAFVDFGSSSFADQRYMLPNFLAHIGIYTLAGYIDKNLAQEYIHTTVDAYKKIEPVDESLFCQYFAMEVLHRANGKWVSGIDSADQKLACYGFGLRVFDNKISSISDLVKMLV